MLEFNKENHEYSVDGKKLISVTQLLTKHGLSASYDAVDRDTLQKACDHGTLVHEEIAKYLKTGEQSFCPEVELVAKQIRRMGIIDNLKSEQSINNDIVAGTYDFYFDDCLWHHLVDFKTSSAKHLMEWSWQLAVYAKLITEAHPEIRSWDIVKEIWWFHDDTLEVLAAYDIPDAVVDALLDCERRGEKFDRSAHVMQIAGSAGYICGILTHKIKDLEAQLEKLKTERAEKEAVLAQAMTESGTNKFHTARYAITFIPASQRKTFDSAKLKKENPALYAEYCTKTTDVKASMRYTELKEVAND